MEKLPNTIISNERESLIREAFAEKKGREVGAPNPFTCYISIDSLCPNLARLTASLLETLDKDRFESFRWAQRWDKSIIAVAPGRETGCHLLKGEDLRGKMFVPVSTTRKIEAGGLLADIPVGEGALVVLNSQPMTLDAFMISYFHMVNELIWDTALSESETGKVSSKSYGKALEIVMERGFAVTLGSEAEILEMKQREPKTSLRIYGSRVNNLVPEVMGAVIKL